ncbi:putative bifunctional diguanylate cyclase/phosphodiesterase [Gluconobacter roseus]|uniref:putative bifunctional diguanylate cyclase/phosphodiesterase n=1 Tax=Gluconobacter roseus TaxID=586239 RepID=UPI0007813AA3|nr:GGDEF domain-containing phosphodiesterase [Gluconobacter roseus]
MTDDRGPGAGSSAGKGKEPEDPAADGPGTGGGFRAWGRRSLLLRWVAFRFLRGHRGGVLAPQVPTHLQSAFKGRQLRTLRLLLPLHLLAQAVSAPVVALGVWSSGCWLAAVPLLGVWGALLVWILAIQPRIQRLRDYSCADDRSVRRALRQLNGALGIVWFVFIILAFRLHREDVHVLTIGVCAGLMAPLLLCAPVAGAVEAMMVPILAGMYGALLEGCLHRSLPFTASFVIEVTVCGLFVAGVSRLVNVLLWRMQMTRLKEREQSEILSLLMPRSVSQGGGWLWETDEEGRLRNPSAGLCQMLGRVEAEVAGQSLYTVLGLPDSAPGNTLLRAELSGAMSPDLHLAHCLGNRLAFRELAVRALPAGKWWMLTGQPVFREGIFRGYRGVGMDVTALQATREQHFHRVRVDAPTGLPNRLACLEHVQRRLLEVTRGAQDFVLALVSLDVSGPEGRHEVCAEEAAYLLQVSASRLGALPEQRGEDHAGAGNRFVARHGVMDLAVMVDVPRDGKGRFPAALAQEMLSVLSGVVKVPGGAVVTLEPAIGMAVSGVENGDALVEAAETALKDARRERVGRYSIFDPCGELADSRQKNLFRDVRQALQMKAFALVYQPIASARTGQVVGFEALCRWKGSSHGYLSIEKVIDIIIETGNGLEFDFWVLETACRTARQWPLSLWVSVNMTATHFSLPDIADRIFDVLERTGLPPQRLQVEVTETRALEAGPLAYHAFRELERRGVRIALDDFGKGFSTLMYLRQFPFSKIKLDAAFIQDMLQDARSAAVVRNVIELAMDLGIAVTAEGVSSPEHYRHLQEHGCTEVRGFFLGPPVPEETVPLCWRRNVAGL